MEAKGHKMSGIKRLPVDGFDRVLKQRIHSLLTPAYIGNTSPKFSYSETVKHHHRLPAVQTAHASCRERDRERYPEDVCTFETNWAHI